MTRFSEQSYQSIRVPIRAHYLCFQQSAEAQVLLLGFHGYAETAGEQMERLRALELSKETVLCAPEACHRFYTRKGTVVASWMSRRFRETAIEDTVLYIDTLITQLKEASAITQIHLMGFSQGAALAYRYALLGSHQVSRCVVIGSDIPPEHRKALESLPPTLVCHGQDDERVDAAVFDTSCEQLAAAGVRYESFLYPGGHAPNEVCLQRVSAFLNA